MEKQFSEQDEKVIKMLSKIYDMSEEEVRSRYIPMSEESKKSISIKTISLPETKKKKETKEQKIKRKFNFLKEVMCTSIAVQTENGTKLEYMISDDSLREDLQFRIMTLVNDYLK